MDAGNSLASALFSVVVESDAMYEENAGEPAPTSTAALEVTTHDAPLAKATGTLRPLFGTYADAEAKLRSLNDLVRSFTVLLASSDVHLGQIVIARAAIETAARMRWGLAVDDDYRERAARWLRERLRTIEEVAKLAPQARQEMERLGLARQVIEGARAANLNVIGPPPAAIDLVWPLMSAANSPLKIAGLDRETAMLLFYRSPSALMHGTPHGLTSHFTDPRADVATRGITAEPLEESLILTAGILNAYANAHGALVALYGWDGSRANLAIATAAQQLSTALKAAQRRD